MIGIYMLVCSLCCVLSVLSFIIGQLEARDDHALELKNSASYTNRNTSMTVSTITAPRRLTAKHNHMRKKGAMGCEHKLEAQELMQGNLDADDTLINETERRHIGHALLAKEVSDAHRSTATFSLHMCTSHTVAIPLITLSLHQLRENSADTLRIRLLTMQSDALVQQQPKHCDSHRMSAMTVSTITAPRYAQLNHDMRKMGCEIKLEAQEMIKGNLDAGATATFSLFLDADGSDDEEDAEEDAHADKVALAMVAIDLLMYDDAEAL